MIPPLSGGRCRCVDQRQVSAASPHTRLHTRGCRLVATTTRRPLARASSLPSHPVQRSRPRRRVTVRCMTWMRVSGGHGDVYTQRPDQQLPHLQVHLHRRLYLHHHWHRHQPRKLLIPGGRGEKGGGYPWCDRHSNAQAQRAHFFGHGIGYLAALGNAHSGVIVFIDDPNQKRSRFLLAHTGRGPVDQARGPVLKVIHSSNRAPRDDMQRNIQVHRNFRPAAHSRIQYACKHVPIRCTQYFTCRVR